jgi:hypothetical protein
MSSFDKKNGFECAMCGERIGGGDYDFHQSLALAKEEGWINRTDCYGDWFKFCSHECYNKWKPLHT